MLRILRKLSNLKISIYTAESTCTRFLMHFTAVDVNVDATFTIFF